MLVGATLLGCPWFKKKDDGAAAAASASAASAAAAASAKAQVSAPSVIALVSEPSASASALVAEIPDDDAVDASVAAADASFADAAREGGPSSDAPSSDAPRSDASGDAKGRDAGKAPPGIKKLDDEFPVKGKRKITVTNANVHRSPKDGVTMTTIAKGTEVRLIAQYFDWYRVSFTDVTTGKKAQGWIYLTNFLGPRRKSCPESWTYHYLEDGGWCERECSKKNDCKALKDYKCSGGSCYYDGE
jgi:hypothetical protein